MDVLKPDLLYIKGRCFRINPMKVNLNSDLPQQNWSSSKNTYEDEDCTLDFNDSEGEEEDHCVIECIDGKRYRTAFHIARPFFPLLIGTKGATRKRLETETKTQINVPKFGQDGDVVITGFSRNGVRAAHRRVNLIVLTARRRQQYTHFISVPFNGGQIKQRFLEFKQEVLEKCKDRGIEESAFQSPDRLHMTLCTMVLSDDVERKNASAILQDCKTNVIDKILNGQPLKIRLSGIEIMNDDPSEVCVLYGKVHCQDDSMLQTLCDSIVNYFADAGLIEKEYERVKLHITLMNSKFSKSSSEYESKRNRSTINASSILMLFQDYDFGEETVQALHLSQMGAASSSGYYKSSCTINIS